MDVDWVRRYCMALPHTTETVQWGANLVFKIAGKIYAMAELEAADHWVSFKLIFYTMSAEVIHSRLVAILKTA